MLLITGVDDYLGYCIASHLSQSKSLRKDMRVLYTKSSSWIKNFQSKGIDTQAIADYTHPDQLSKAMRNITQVILTLGSHPNRVQHCQSIIQVAIRSSIKSIIFLSHIGAQSEQHEFLYDYGLIENQLIEQEQITWTLFRLDWIQQYFHLWSTQIEQTRKMSLPMMQETEMCPIDISDVCLCIESCVVEDSQLLIELNECHAGQVYTLTGPEALKIKHITQMMSNATQYMKYKYHMCRPMDTRFYLKNLGYDIWFDERIKNEKSKSYHDLLDCNQGYRSKAFSVPNDVLIDTLMNYFDWIDKTSGSIPVNHIKLFSKTPKTMQDFFQENANSFKPKV